MRVLMSKIKKSDSIHFLILIDHKLSDSRYYLIFKMSDWFSSLANQAKQLADNLTETIVTSANAAKDEFQQEQMKIRQEVERSRIKSTNEVNLPWETDDESLAILSQALMEKIFALSLSDRNFTVTSQQLSDFQFVFKDYIPVAMKLLTIDANLSRIHAKISPKMDEEIFWLRYYQRCMYLRAVMGFEGPEMKERYLKIAEDTVIFVPSFEADYNMRKDMSRAHDEIAAIASTTASSATKKAVKSEREVADEKLKAEVEEELNNGDIDLSDLGDITGDDDFENIGADDVDEDLEAAIARELGEIEG